ncbi:hypothetical protein D477_002643 [Arthrobacter crystallopoietes BAB-32]|uniref:Uncharacterized protein n=1 Tax=Arthrobacter crystallopoietes BAB-32 TaxID=1246476 RepID=N1V354_9MICC|nr:hypothetical protein [Arthrobacter crystallopoietes]EMY35755.1 hypothetical protein D477_002643 [Arthrobacter crystallopoietes BAB-32]
MARNPLPSKKCSRIKNNGDPCGLYAIQGGSVCHKHGGSAPQVKKKAAERIAEAADDAAALLVQFMEDPKNDVKVRTQIAQDLLNRAGYNSRQAVDLTVSKFDEAVANGEFLIDLGESDANEIAALEVLAEPEHKVQLRKRRTQR